MPKIALWGYLLGASLTSPVWAGESAFQAGPVFPTFGKIAPVVSDMAVTTETRLQVAFDVGKAGDVGKLNRTLNSAARFINMHAAAGVPVDNIKVAVVVHGGASFDLTRDSRYGQKKDGAQNANRAAIKALTEKGVEIYLCGQSAAYHDIKKIDLLPGVNLALSAMTAHALLQQKGYTLNPF
ncbi:hypothetical protein CRD36_05455 [Paremcibacter congregatus]|uniref:Uncharacterized protein n=2 Tax=Paremcibacter congregatus TaxID=2043170 RepID=A0A2G4YVI9_9PROT|nr:hypothetical protein CRD36_05455 [Paremcibacter congregatus]QDE29201.1 DsrE family protein [Paremcibacter congregatus]